MSKFLQLTCGHSLEIVFPVYLDKNHKKTENKNGRLNYGILPLYLSLRAIEDLRLDMDLSHLRESFLAQLSSSSDLDDPLALHQQYIERLKAIPSSEQSSRLLLEALERCTQAFIDDRRYANDPRYLRAWLDYASRCREPEDVFAFLGMRGVCQDLAAYYEEYAGYLERRKIEQTGSYWFHC